MDETDNLAELPEPETIDTNEDEIDELPEGEDTPEAESPEPDDDSEEIDYEGKTFKVPRELKDAFLRQSDYTQKTQQVAETRKALEAQIERIASVSEAETKALSQVAIIEGQIAQYNDIDWDAWDQSDPVAANRARWQYTELNRQKGEAINAYHEAQRQVQFVAQQETARRLEQGQRVLAEKIPGWGQDKAAAILDFGVSYGFDRADLQSIDNPMAILALNELMELRKAANKAATAKKIEKQQAVKPAPTVKGGATVIKGLDDRLSTEEWFKRRNAQTRGR